MVDARQIADGGVRVSSIRVQLTYFKFLALFITMPGADDADVALSLSGHYWTVIGHTVLHRHPACDLHCHVRTPSLPIPRVLYKPPNSDMGRSHWAD